MEINKLHQQVIIGSATGLLVISSIIGLVPLYYRLKQEQHRYIVTLARTKAVAIQSLLDQYETLAQRLSLQPQLVKAFQSHSQGQIKQRDFITLEKEFWETQVNDSLVGITSLDHRGVPIFRLGVPIPESLQKVSVQASENSPVSKIFQDHQNSYFVIQVPIKNKQRWGTNVLLFRLSPLQDLLKYHSDFSEARQTSLVRLETHQASTVQSSVSFPSTFTFLPQSCFNDQSNTHKFSLFKGCSYEDSVSVYAYSSLAKLPWGIVFKLEKKEFYAPIKQQIFTTGTTIALLIFLGTGGVIVIIRPFITRMRKEIGERKQAEINLQIEKNFTQSLFETNPAFFMVIDRKGQIQFANETMLQAIGYSLEEIKGKDYITLIPSSYSDLWYQNLITITKEKLQNSYQELPLLTRRDQIIWVQWQGKTLMSSQTGEVELIFVAGIDITERQRAEEQLRYNAYHDALTGLWNRAAFLERLEQAIARQAGFSAQLLPRESQSPLFAILFLDLDGFKLVNDSLGHWIGDQLLVAIAHRLQSCLQLPDTLARFGGDEFTILLENLATPEEAITVAQNIQLALRQPFELANHTVFTETSIGIVESTPEYQHPHELLRDADTAMYCAKAKGKNSYVVFDQAMREQAVRRLQLETNLRLALEREEFEVYYQPLVRLATGETVGFEALIRWHHPTRGSISPVEFIPVAEETGAIAAIGAWVLRRSCTQLQQWKAMYAGNSTLRLSVNLSSKQLTPQLIPTIDQILAETGTEGWEIKLELTETALMQDPKAAIAILHQLKNRDIGLCVDDFGTGYCSLEYLHQFPVDVLKIDRAFVNQMSSNHDQGQIVQAILALAHSLGIDAIAEGIETREQMYKLRLLRCKYGQGYYFSKPLTATTVETLLAEQKLRNLIYTSTGKPH